MRKHTFDPASFILGLVISGVAVAYLVAEAQDRTVDGAWVLPLALIGLGVAAVAAGLNRALRRPVRRAPTSRARRPHQRRPPVWPRSRRRPRRTGLPEPRDTPVDQAPPPGPDLSSISQAWSRVCQAIRRTA